MVLIHLQQPGLCALVQGRHAPARQEHHGGDGHWRAEGAQAKTYTEQAETALGYSSAEIASVTAAWQAVGVGAR
jgi:hypothetical protein